MLWPERKEWIGTVQRQPHLNGLLCEIILKHICGSDHILLTHSFKFWAAVNNLLLMVGHIIGSKIGQISNNIDNFFLVIRVMLIIYEYYFFIISVIGDNLAWFDIHLELEASDCMVRLVDLKHRARVCNAMCVEVMLLSVDDSVGKIIHCSLLIIKLVIVFIIFKDIFDRVCQVMTV